MQEFDPAIEAMMTQRDYFAVQALIGLLSGYYSDTTKLNGGEVFREANLIADEMMNERAKS